MDIALVVVAIGAVALLGFLFMRAEERLIAQANKTREADIELTTQLVEKVAAAMTGRPNDASQLADVIQGWTATDMPDERIVPDTELDMDWFPRDTQELLEGNVWPDNPTTMPQPPE